MKKFLVLFLTPVAVLENWMNTEESERKAVEDKMKADWSMWMEKNKDAIVEMPAGAGKTKKISQDGVTDIKNEVMMYGVVQAESPEAAAELFVGHPHLDIPEGTIEIMTINPMAMN